MTVSIDCTVVDSCVVPGAGLDGIAYDADDDALFVTDAANQVILYQPADPCPVTSGSSGATSGPTSFWTEWRELSPTTGL